MLSLNPRKLSLSRRKTVSFTHQKYQKGDPWSLGVLHKTKIYIYIYKIPMDFASSLGRSWLPRGHHPSSPGSRFSSDDSQAHQAKRRGVRNAYECCMSPLVSPRACGNYQKHANNQKQRPCHHVLDLLSQPKAKERYNARKAFRQKRSMAKEKKSA